MIAAIQYHVRCHPALQWLFCPGRRPAPPRHDGTPATRCKTHPAGFAARRETAAGPDDPRSRGRIFTYATICTIV